MLACRSYQSRNDTHTHTHTPTPTTTQPTRKTIHTHTQHHTHIHTDTHTRTTTPPHTHPTHSRGRLYNSLPERALLSSCLVKSTPPCACVYCGNLCVKESVCVCVCVCVCGVFAVWC